MKNVYDALDYIGPEIVGEIKKRERDNTVFMWLKAFENMPDEDKPICVTHFVNEAKILIDIIFKLAVQGDAIVGLAALDGLQELVRFTTDLLPTSIRPDAGDDK